MVRFKSGLGMLIAGTPIPVVPCRIGGAYESLSRDQRFPRPRRITVAIGLFALMTYAVVQRRHEIAIRMSLFFAWPRFSSMNTVSCPR